MVRIKTENISEDYGTRVITEIHLNPKNRERNEIKNKSKGER